MGKNLLKKGYRSEVRVAEYMESLGFRVHTTKRVQYSNNDIFGLYDHICISSEAGGIDIPCHVYRGGRSSYGELGLSCGNVCLVQTKSNRRPSPVVLRNWHFYANGSILLLWCNVVDREGIEIFDVTEYVKGMEV